MYSEALAHIIYAAADFVIVPSLFEPCGLTQLIAMRYGALPIVRRTGGLGDTVSDINAAAALGDHRSGSALTSPSGNGFVFDGADEGSCSGALERALRMYRERRDVWDTVSVRNMDLDYSWAQPAATYLDMYRKIA